MNRRLVAYLMLSVTLAATVFCYALLQGMAGSQIAGASSQRRYFTLGVDTTRGQNYTLGGQFVDTLMQRLPHSFVIATEFEIPANYSSAALPDGSRHVAVSVNMVSTHYFEAVDLPNVLGRVITPAEAHAHESEMVINRRCAVALFGSTRAAINRLLVLHVSSKPDVSLQVVGVIADKFTGIRAAGGDVSRPVPMVWVINKQRLFDPALLSVPANLSDEQIQHDLNSAWQRLSDVVRGKGDRGLVFTQPFSMEPGAVAAAAHRLKLYLGISFAALLLTLTNLVAVNFLEALRRRTVHAIERTLGASRAWQMRRVLYRSLLGALVTLVVSGALLVAALMITQHSIASIDRLRFSPWARVHRALHWSHLLIPAVALTVAVILIEVLVHGMLLTREQRTSGSIQVSGPRGERQVGGVILALEFTLAALLAVLASWGAQYAWRMAHEHLGMLQGQRLTVLSMEINKAYISAHPHAISRFVSNAVLTADLQHAVAGIEPTAETGFGPVVGMLYRHGAGDFRRGSGKLEAAHAGIMTQAFAVSASWLPVGGVRLLAGRAFNPGKPDAREILIDAKTAQTLFGGVQTAVGRLVYWRVFWSREPITFRVQGVIAPLHLNGPGRAPVPSVIEQLKGSGRFFMAGNDGAFLIRPAIPEPRYSALQDAVQRVFAKDAPFLEVSSIRSSTQLLDMFDRSQRILATVFGAVAGFGLLIALTGLLVFLRLFLALRKRVDAIRQALGASPRRQYTGVLLGTLALAGAGALLALLFTPWLAQQFALLSGAQGTAYGAATWIALAVLLLAVFLVAHFPARRAARAEPAESLHEL